MTTMIKKRVAELEGAQLNWVVAKAAGLAVDRISSHGYVTLIDPITTDDLDDRYVFNPAGEWRDGGPIIEREGLVVAKFWEPADGPITPGLEWASMTLDDKHRMDGPTPLIAAMRAFVASKLGDEVEVPA